MNYAVAIVSLILFVIGFRFARVVPVAVEALVSARSALAVVGDRGKSEDEKERAARQASIALFGRFFAILFLTLAALVPATLFVFVAVMAGLTDETVMETLVSPWIIAIAIVLFIGEYVVRR